MNKLSRLINTYAALITLTLFSSVALATSDPNKTTFLDPDDAYGGYDYRIHKMDVIWDNSNNINIDVYTNFAGRSGTDGYSYGDLLISTDTTPTQSSDWDYAFKLQDWNSNTTTTKHGDLVKTNGSFAYARSQPVYVLSSGHTDTGVDGSWQIIPDVRGGQQGIISFSFNVQSVAALADVSQLAFRWAMTCANDVVSGVVTRSGNNNQVPEPAALALILSGLAGLGFVRRRRTTTEQLEA